MSLSQRDAFFNKLYDLMKADPDIFLVSADMGAPSLDRLRRDLPRQYIDAGIAEQNALLLSAGLCKAGKKAFVYAIAPFVSYRIVEMIRLDLCSMNLPVSIVGVGAGMSYDDSGPTHHTTEDLSMLRCLPNLKIFNCSDENMAAALAEKSLEIDYPNYIRLDRKMSPFAIDWDRSYQYEDGVMVNQSNPDYWIIATGNMVYRALEVADEFKNVGVMNMYMLPCLSEPFLSLVNDAKGIFTLEEHELRGGMGSMVLEMLSDGGLQIPVKRFGLDFRDSFCYQYGGREHLQGLYGLDKETLIVDIINELSLNKP